jgi:hypothetical protein
VRLLRPAAGVLFIILVCLETEIAVGGQYADAMAKCLIQSASPQDRTLLVKWIFGIASLHPELASMSSITNEQRDILDKSAAALFQRLLLESCKSETQQAFKNEGSQTMAYAFNILGQVAIGGMFNDPHVLEGMKNFPKYIDQGKLKALTSPGTPR